MLKSIRNSLILTSLLYVVLGLVLLMMPGLSLGFACLFIGGGFGIGTVVAVLLIIGFVYLLVRPYKESATLSVSTNKMFSK